MSDELLKYFQTPDIIRHPGGHFVPTTGDQKKSFITFFEKMQTSFAWSLVVDKSIIHKRRETNNILEHVQK